MAISLPVLLLVLLEVALRIGGYGYETGFFKEAEIDGRPRVVSNERFTLRFFPPELARWPAHFSFEKHKPPGTIRIFVFGESAVMGDPQPSFGASRFLQVLLEERFPTARFEIINTGITAINSHVVRPIARDCAKHNGDIWIIYMGNNEMVGPFGAATVFGTRAPPLAAVRFNLALQRTRTGQWFTSLMRKLAGASENTSWGGMRMFLNNQIPPDDPRRDTVYKNFAANLDDIVSAGLDSGAKIILNTMSVNLKDCPPFASLNNTNLPAGDRERFDRFYREAIELHTQRRFADAAAMFEQATGVDAQFAEAQFRWADCLLRLTNSAARERFQVACDTDALPFRSDTRINAAIREIAATKQNPSLTLCDVESVMARRSPGGIAGDETFFEHVHFTPEGNYALALEWAGEVEKLLPAEVRNNARGEWATQERCELWLGMSVWNIEFLLQSVVSRMNGPPLNNQFNNGTRRAALEKKIAVLRQQQAYPGALEQTRRAFAAALERAPKDFYLRESYANFLEGIGDTKDAAGQYRAMTTLSANDHYSLLQYGRLLAESGNPAEAEVFLRDAVRVRPSIPEGWVELGKALVLRQKFEEALQSFEHAVKLRPRDATFAGYRAQTLARLGRRTEAIATYRAALELNPNVANLRFQLAVELAADDKTVEAAGEFQQTLQASPGHISARLNLGVLLVRMNRLKEAEGQFEAALQLAPDNQKARDYLEQVRSRLSSGP